MYLKWFLHVQLYLQGGDTIMIHADQNMRNISLSVNDDQMEKKDVIKGYVKCRI